MEEENLIFGIFSLLFVMSLILFANLCVKLEKKKEDNTERYVQTRKSETTESMQRLQYLAAIESGTGSSDRSIPHRHLSTNTSHYSDKRHRPFPSYTPIDKSSHSHSHSRSNSSVSPKSVNSLELSNQRSDLERFRIGSESQKLRRDNPMIVTGHQRQRSMEVHRSFNYPPTPRSPLPSLKRPTHLVQHEQLKRTEPVPQFNRENSLRSSNSTLASQKRSLYQPRTPPCSSVTTGILPMESHPPHSPSTDGSTSDASRHKVAAVPNPIIPKYSDSKAKGTPVRSTRMEHNESPITNSNSPYREYSGTPSTTPSTNQTNQNQFGLAQTQITESNSIPKPQYYYPRLVKRQLSYEDSNCYPPYYQPTTDSTCQLYSTQANKSLPLRMRFPKLSNGTDFADDETEGTSVCQSIYSSYTSLYQTDTEEFMIGDPQAIKLSRELESPYPPTTEHRTPLVAHYAKQYTENLLRTTRLPSNLSDLSDSDVSFTWQGGETVRHEYTPHDLSVSIEKRGVVLPRTGYRKQGYTDYSGGLSFMSFVRKDSIPEETQTTGISSRLRTATSPSRFTNYSPYTQSPGYIPTEIIRFAYPNVDSPSSTNTPIHSNSMSHSNDNLKTPQRPAITGRNSRSHPNLHYHKQPHSNSTGGPQLEHSSPIRTSPYYPKLNYDNRNNSNNEMSSSGISLTHL